MNGREITDAINADPAEVERLRRSRANARAAVSRLWAKDWDSPEDAMWDEWKDESAEWAEATFDAAAEAWPD